MEIQCGDMKESERKYNSVNLDNKSIACNELKMKE